MIYDCRLMIDGLVKNEKIDLFTRVFRRFATVFNFYLRKMGQERGAEDGISTLLQQTSSFEYPVSSIDMQLLYHSIGKIQYEISLLAGAIARTIATHTFQGSDK